MTEGVLVIVVSLWYAPAKLRLDRVVVLFVYYIVHGIAVDEQILLQEPEETGHTHVVSYILLVAR